MWRGFSCLVSAYRLASSCCEYSPVRVRDSNGVRPSLLATISCGISLHGDDVTNFHSVLAPSTLLQIERAFQLDRPIRDCSWTLDVKEQMHMRIGPIDTDNSSVEHYRLIGIELCCDRVMRRHRRGCQQGNDNYRE